MDKKSITGISLKKEMWSEDFSLGNDWLPGIHFLWISFVEEYSNLGFYSTFLAYD